MASDFQVEKDKALVENTAQSIFNTLRELEGGRSVYEKRWPWELLQNAVDVARPGGVDCTFILTDSELTFRHKGAPFKMKEIAHLIYHGSTKIDEPGKIRFGTGFITTHLLSRKPRIKGVIEDGRRFEFELDREGASWKELQSNMGKTEQIFLNSLGRDVIIPEGAVAEYIYPLSQEGRLTATEGIQAVQKNIAFVLALNENLSAVTITEKGSKTTWSRLTDGVKKIDQRITIVPIQSISNEHRTAYSVVVASDGFVAIALLLSGNHPDYSLESMEAIPKLFYGFPLTTTEDFPLPIVINSPSFVPREKRDGLLLGPDHQKDNLHNKALLEKSAELFQVLVDTAINLRWQRLYQLAKIKVLPSKEWLDQYWLKELCAKLISHLRESDLVEQRGTPGSELRRLSPKTAYIPYDADPDNLRRMATLAQYIYADKLPDQNLIEEWANILIFWSPYLDTEPSKMDEAFTIECFAQGVSQLSSLESLTQKLTASSRQNTIDWLNEFLALVHKARVQLLSELNLIPCQLGQFQKRTHIFRDGHIDEVLKEVMTLLGSEIREKLCDLSIIVSIQDSLATYEEKTVLAEAISLLKKKTESQDEYCTKDYEKANVTMFSWLSRKGRFELLGDNFPVITFQKDKGDTEYITRLLLKEPLLKPVSLWDEIAKPYATVFPDHMILSNLYVDKMDNESWQNLVTHGLLLGNLFVKETEAFDDLMVRKLLATGGLNEQEEHGTEDEMELTSIAYLEAKDWGILDKVRRSKQKAMQFLEFLLGYAVLEDDSWVNPVSLKCSCEKGEGTHTIYPSKWLYALKARQWVPISKNKEELPTTENLAPFFQNNKRLLEHMVEDQPSTFLNVLGVSSSQIMMASQPKPQRLELDKAFVKLLMATDSNVQELTKIAEVYRNPSLRTKLEEAFGLREKVKRNQTVGNYVEKILRELLQKCLPSDKFKVYKIRKGADIAIDLDLEFDLVDENYQPIALGVLARGKELSIEVKSTSSDYVRMTLAQAKEAIENIDSFLLCVVELPFGFEELPIEEAENLVRQKALFLRTIGSKLESKFKEAQEFRVKQEEIKLAPSDDITIDSSELQIRLRLNKKLWTEGTAPVLAFDQLTDLLTKAVSVS